MEKTVIHKEFLDDWQTLTDEAASENLPLTGPLGTILQTVRNFLKWTLEAFVPRRARYSDVQIDPDTTILPLIITEHANCPNVTPEKGFWFIRTIYYSEYGSKFQIAYKQSSDLAVRIRYYNNMTWTPWSRIDATVSFNGVGFVKANGAAVSYDNTSYEPSFTKNTAFNRNFGTTAGTVCEGNDPRLSGSGTGSFDRLQMRPPTGDIHTWLDGAEEGMYWMIADGQTNEIIGAGGATCYYKGQVMYNVPDNEYYSITGYYATETIQKPIQVKWRRWGIWTEWQHIGDGCNAAKLEGNPVTEFYRYLGSLISNVNADDLKTPGLYFLQTGNGTGNSNFPVGYGVFSVEGRHFISQKCCDYNGVIYSRCFDGSSTWSSWERLAKATEIPTVDTTGTGGGNNVAAGLNSSNQVLALGGFFQTSDERKKTVISEIGNAVANISKLRKVYYSLKETPEKQEIGILAQDVQQVYPEVVSSDDDGFFSVNYAKLSVLALTAVDELSAELRSVNEKITRIEQILNI